MQFFYRFYIRLTIIILFSLMGCSKSTKQNPTENKPEPVEILKKEMPEKSKKKIKPNKEKETINEKNAVVFLTEYGQENPETIVRLKTRLGNITIKLYKETPLHRANFIFLVKEGYFNTTCFYRVVPDFIIQAGDSENLTTQRMRNQFKNYKLPAEFHPDLKHTYGAVAAARDWEDNPLKKSTAFEFYIIQHKEGGHHLDGEHTVFGQVLSGFDAIDKIANLKAGGDEWPLKDVYIEAEIIR